MSAVGLSILQARMGMLEQTFQAPFVRNNAQLKTVNEVSIPATITERVTQAAERVDWFGAFTQGAMLGMTNFKDMCVANMSMSYESGALTDQADLVVSQFLARYTIANSCILKMQYTNQTQDFRIAIKETTNATDEDLEEGFMILACAEAGNLRKDLEETEPAFLNTLVENYDGKWELAPVVEEAEMTQEQLQELLLRFILSGEECNESDE
jgi:hypothetical protein